MGTGVQSTSFEMLLRERPILADLDGFAGQYAHSDPSSALVKLRSLGEQLDDFANNCIDTSNLKRISPDIEGSYVRSRLVGDETLVSCVGSIGLVALADENLKGMNIVQAVARVPLNDSVCREFIAYVLKSDFCQHHFRKETRTVSQPTLNISLITETPIIRPPEKEQQLFAEVFEKFGQWSEKLEIADSSSEELFQSLSQRAFRGEL